MTTATGSRPNELQRQVSIEFIRSSGGYAVRANPGSKAPASGWSPAHSNKATSDAALAQLAPDENLGLHMHGDLIDVDVDTDDPMSIAALDHFLPPCSHVWGRPSRLRTHRVYKVRGAFDPDAYPILSRIKKTFDVEVRGGQVTRGDYSLLPGSIHPSGEHYEWHDLRAAQSTPSVVTAARIVTAIRKAAGASRLARHWVEGVRQDLAMALAGFLHRVWSSNEQAEDEEPSEIVMDMDEGIRFLRSICALADDDASDIYARVKAFEATWKKADKGGVTTGASRIAELTGDNEIVRFLYETLSENPNGKRLDDMLENYAIRRNTTDVIDLGALAAGSVRAAVMPVRAFVSTYGFEKFVRSDGRKARIVDVFFDLAATKRISGLDIDPTKPRVYMRGDEMIANSWAGFEVPPSQSSVEAEQVAMFTDYVHEILADSNADRAHWITSWIADIVQDPKTRPGTALVLVGKPGAGKSVLGHAVLIPLIGKAHATTTNSVDRITRQFNANFANKLLIQCDEAINNRQRSTAAKLKSLITDPLVHIEPKGVNGWDQTNLARFMFTSNELDDAISITDGTADRRYAVYEVSSKRIGDTEYWDAFHAWFEDPGNLAMVHRYLLDYKYDKAKIRRTDDFTDAKVRLIEQSMSPFDEWLATWVSQEYPLSEGVHDRHWYTLPNDGKNPHRDTWPDFVYTSALVEDFKRFTKSRTNTPTEVWLDSQMRTKLIAIMGGDPISVRTIVTNVDPRTNIVSKMRPRLYSIPSLQEVCDYLNKKYGTKYAPEEDEDQAQPEDPHIDHDEF